MLLNPFSTVHLSLPNLELVSSYSYVSLVLVSFLSTVITPGPVWLPPSDTQRLVYSSNVLPSLHLVQIKAGMKKRGFYNGHETHSAPIE
jgi:hypothetical protein